MKISENLSDVWTHATDFVVERGEGSWLYTDCGRKLLDFTSGIGVNSTGHSHSKVVSAIQKQAEKLLFSQINCVYHDGINKACDALSSVVPNHLDKFFLTNSGAEAVEASVKLAKHATGKPNVIVFHGSFHGRTHLTMAMTTSKTKYRMNYAPLPSGIYMTPYPYAFMFGMDDEQMSDFSMNELDKLLHTVSAPEETAAVIIEPILGEGGYVLPPKGFLKKVKQLCAENNILMIIDEIQSGFGRSGKAFAHEFDDVQPDIMTMAKGIGSGFPVSGIAYRSELGEKWIKGTHGGTYCAGPMACAAVTATIEAITTENLIQNAADRGVQLQTGLKEIAKEFPIIADIRGRGLMVGTELMNADGTPAADLPGKILKSVYENNLLLISCGIRKNVIRWIPPLVVTPAEIDTGLDIFRRALKEVGA